MDARLVLVGAGLGLVVVAAAAYAARRYAPGVGHAVNPLNRDNVFVSGANALVRELTGEPTLGGWIATWINPDVSAADASMAAPVGAAPGYDLSYSNLIPVSDYFHGAP